MRFFAFYAVDCALLAVSANLAWWGGAWSYPLVLVALANVILATNLLPLAAGKESGE